jgi:hypothetical protein
VPRQHERRGLRLPQPASWRGVWPPSAVEIRTERRSCARRQELLRPATPKRRSVISVHCGELTPDSHYGLVRIWNIIATATLSKGTNLSKLLHHFSGSGANENATTRMIACA